MAYFTIRVSEEFKLSLQQLAGDESLSEFIRHHLESVTQSPKSARQHVNDVTQDVTQKSIEVTQSVTQPVNVVTQDEIIKKLVTQTKQLSVTHEDVPQEEPAYREVNYSRLKQFRQ
jgi:predicted transcriptional regulator